MVNPVDKQSYYLWKREYISPTIGKIISTEGMTKRDYGMTRMLPPPLSLPKPSPAPTPRLEIQKDRRGWAKRSISQEELQAALKQLQKEEPQKIQAEKS